MEVSPTGQAAAAVIPPLTDPVALLHIIANLQSQNLELQKQNLELQRQHLELTRETVHVAREQRAKQVAELEKWQAGHEHVMDACKEALGRLEQVHAALMGDMANHLDDNYENLLEGDFSLSDFVDRFGPKLAHLNTMLAVLRPLTLNLKRPDAPAAG